jgi:RimJ/RimL family protein N-acetyltransferase
MRHDICLSGPAFRIRPITDSDAEFVLKLRTNPALNRFLHETSSDVNEQLAWLSTYYERQGDYYFVIERNVSGTPEGVISLYNIEPRLRIGEWGRWILNPSSLAAVESAMLIYRCAFDILKLDTVYCQTIAANDSIVSFHDSCKIPERKLLPGYLECNGMKLDAIQHSLQGNCWADIDQRLFRLATLTARRLNSV